MKENIDMQPHAVDHDDTPVGRILGRREALALLGAAGASLLASCTSIANPSDAPTPSPSASGAAGEHAAQSAATAPAPQCVVRPEMSEGPFYVETQLHRADLRTDPATGTVKEGLPLTLAFNVTQIANGTCTPLPDAVVDVWHCDAQGVYSGVSGDDALWLRGYQITDTSGTAAFSTVYPGWYPGRTAHIHFKIRTPTGTGAHHEFTSQLYFDDALSEQIYAQAPYAQGSGRRTTNAADGLFQYGGDQLLLALEEADGSYAATFPIALDLSEAAAG